MTLIDQIRDLAAAYAAATGLEPSTVSWRVFGDTKKLAMIADGADLTTRRFEAAVSWFSAHWPAGAAWPATVRRPEVAA
jgi:hypothetical protein